VWRHVHRELDETKSSLEHWKDLAEERSRTIDLLMAELAGARSEVSVTRAEVERLRTLVDLFASARAVANLSGATERLEEVVEAAQRLQQAVRDQQRLLADNNPARDDQQSGVVSGEPPR
jgi:hypothetical protein